MEEGRKKDARRKPYTSCPASTGHLLDIRINPVLQQNATKEDREAHIDIADWLLRSFCHPERSEGSRWHLDFLKAAEFISPEHHAEVEAMIHDLELEFWGGGEGGGQLSL